jgi:TolA-binding protein
VHVRRLFEVTAPSYSAVMPEAYGAEMKFTCGPRGSIYNGQASSSDFATCVQNGAEQAKARDKRSGKDEAELQKLRDEIDTLRKELEPLQDAADNADENSVVEAQAKADEKALSLQIKEDKLAELLSEKPLTLSEYDDEIVVRVDFKPLSQCEFSPGTLREISSPTAGENATYSENANARAATAMIRRGEACKTVDNLNGDTFLFAGSAVGSYTGADTPKNTRSEVILSPVDVLAWLA